VTEIQLQDYSYENLEIASKGWTQPVLVRGLFANTGAIKKMARS